MNGENVMTDFQFKAIMAMVSSMLDKCKSIDDLNETKNAIIKLSGNLIAPEERKTKKKPQENSEE